MLCVVGGLSWNCVLMIMLFYFVFLCCCSFCLECTSGCHPEFDAVFFRYYYLSFSFLWLFLLFVGLCYFIARHFEFSLCKRPLIILLCCLSILLLALCLFLLFCCYFCCGRSSSFSLLVFVGLYDLPVICLSVYAAVVGIGLIVFRFIVFVSLWRRFLFRSFVAVMLC